MASATTQFIAVDGLNVFYRASGQVGAPVLLALHGFPTSSFQYRHLLAGLGDKYRVIAPDLPGFGFTEVTPERGYVYSFDNLSRTVERFVDALGITSFTLYCFDYGAPTGFRLALRRPELVDAIISQNGNAFDVGLGDFWAPIKALWQGPTEEKSQHLKQTLFSYEMTRYQYTHGESAEAVAHLAPETYFLDYALLARPGNHAIQLALFYDYRENLPLYPAFQRFLQDRAVPLLVAWGKHDPIFVPAGAEAFKTLGLTDLQVVLVDGGHFALESHKDEYLALIRVFLARVYAGRSTAHVEQQRETAAAADEDKKDDLDAAAAAASAEPKNDDVLVLEAL